MNYACVKSDNEIYWSPVPKPEFNAWRDSEETEQSALKAFEDGLTVKYENQEAVLKIMRQGKPGKREVTGPGQVTFTMWQPEPGTCVPIEVEGKVVAQYRHKAIKPYSGLSGIDAGDWRDGAPSSFKRQFEYRKVFRITK